MKNAYIIGVDIGGTNTDAVLIDKSEKIIAAVKTTTTEDISCGFSSALEQLLDQALVDVESIEGIFLGTTVATNAILQNKDLYRVGVIRIAGQKPEILPVAFSWPTDLKNNVIAACETIPGGFECHGGELTPFCKKEAIYAIKRLFEKDVESVAIIGVFSPLNGNQERDVANLVREIAGENFPISISNEIGGIGFIERENSTILNAALKRVMLQGFRSLQAVCIKLGLACPLMITQNDGSLIEVNRAIEYPVLTISAGPTNSFIGASRLAKEESAVVVDIGGTSTDVGIIRNRFPIRSLNRSNIGGVSLNFPMPDVLSIALGGGSIIDLQSDRCTIGPKSVGKFLLKQALCFGGNTFTLTDAAVLMETIKIPQATLKDVPIDGTIIKSIFILVKKQIDQLILKMQGEQKDLPIIFVGGGAALLPKEIFEQSHIPQYFDVANAYGAALAEISGTIDTVVSLQNRQEVLKDLERKARQKAIDQSADEQNLKLVDQQIIPYSYVPNQMARVIIRYCGKRK